MARHLPPVLSNQAAAEGAIAQLGERVVRNDEVGGSIPPGSTTLRPSGYAWRSRAEALAKAGRVTPSVVIPGRASARTRNPFLRMRRRQDGFRVHRFAMCRNDDAISP